MLPEFHSHTSIIIPRDVSDTNKATSSLPPFPQQWTHSAPQTILLCFTDTCASKRCRAGVRSHLSLFSADCVFSFCKRSEFWKLSSASLRVDWFLSYMALAISGGDGGLMSSDSKPAAQQPAPARVSRLGSNKDSAFGAVRAARDWLDRTTIRMHNSIPWHHR